MGGRNAGGLWESQSSLVGQELEALRQMHKRGQLSKPVAQLWGLWYACHLYCCEARAGLAAKVGSRQTLVRAIERAAGFTEAQLAALEPPLCARDHRRLQELMQRALDGSYLELAEACANMLQHSPVRARRDQSGRASLFADMWAVMEPGPRAERSRVMDLAARMAQRLALSDPSIPSNDLADRLILAAIRTVAERPAAVRALRGCYDFAAWAPGDEPPTRTHHSLAGFIDAFREVEVAPTREALHHHVYAVDGAGAVLCLKCRERESIPYCPHCYDVVS